ncbi:hypothetical protein K461DRAFT_146909 [Myriangium duriaei CBS 260.36]|uniref:Uncharacterized protein n=1 Tax=Myriangium duriaei CBS 260.36 TaxID=1168546 RepID=A0A9P4IYX4_9PEZI|nr:hypothetical protein K461DRAFT_146909 [Myriangium duriaei CBS 260.36]
MTRLTRRERKRGDNARRAENSHQSKTCSEKSSLPPRPPLFGATCARNSVDRHPWSAEFTRMRALLLSLYTVALPYSRSKSINMHRMLSAEHVTALVPCSVVQMAYGFLSLYLIILLVTIGLGLRGENK